MLEPECAVVSASHCAGASPVVQLYYRVLASMAGDSVDIPMQATASLGAWQLTNIFHENGSGGASGLCHIDFTNVGLMSALGPP